MNDYSFSSAEILYKTGRYPDFIQIRYSLLNPCCYKKSLEVGALNSKILKFATLLSVLSESFEMVFYAALKIEKSLLMS